MKQLIVIVLALCLTGCFVPVSFFIHDNPSCDGNCENGFGTKKWDDGGYMMGHWRNGNLHGFGYQFFGTTSNFAGDRYVGSFDNEGYAGYGVYYSKRQDFFHKGYWANAKPNGYSKLTLGPKSDDPNRTYEGGWKDGRYNGYGVLCFGDSGKLAHCKYMGNYADGKMHGFGTFYWPNGFKYEGHWKDGDFDGSGTFTFNKYVRIKGHWKSGYDPDFLFFLNEIQRLNLFKIKIDTTQFYYQTAQR